MALGGLGLVSRFYIGIAKHVAVARLNEPGPFGGVLYPQHYLVLLFGIHIGSSWDACVALP